jgi:3-methylfumaryl-CoA hydratase
MKIKLYFCLNKFRVIHKIMQDVVQNISKEYCSLAMVRCVAAMLDLDPLKFNESDFLPKSWHFFMLAGQTRKSELRKDGFPGFAVPMPDLGLPRLLLGGRTVNYSSEILIGSQIEKTSFIKSIVEKTTSSGPFAIVTIQHELRPVLLQNPAIIETQTYILIGESNKTSNLDKSILPVIEAEYQKQIIPDETLLFQYSALGFNSHKIHLDREYAQNVEGLPDLVVNGGLATLLVTEFLTNDLGLEITDIKVKHIAPLYCNRLLTIAFINGELKVFDDNNEIAVVVELN